MDKRHQLTISITILFYLLLIGWVSNHAFFWDAIQFSSLHTLHFYEQGFSSLILPKEIDSGHIPFFGMYQAFLWKIFGQTLWVSHWSILPFVILIIFMAYRLSKAIMPYFWIIPGFLVLCFDPCLMAQVSVISPDAMLIAGFLTCLVGILEGKKWLIGIGALILSLSSNRALMMMSALFLFSLFKNGVSINIAIRDFLKKIIPFLPAGFLALAYLVYHYQQTNWIGYHPDSPWAPSFELVNFKGFVKNLAVLFWRLMDFGHIGFYLLMLYFLRFQSFEKFDTKPKRYQLFILVCLIELFIYPFILFYKGLMGHRYLMPLYLINGLLAVYFLATEPSLQKHSRRLFKIAFVILLTGNLWVYPQKISQGWDASLSYLPYDHLRSQAIEYLDDQNIPLGKVGSAFPNLRSLKETNLIADDSKFKDYNLQEDDYILISNVMNKFSDGEIDQLESNWILEEEWKTGLLFFKLYKRK